MLEAKYIREHLDEVRERLSQRGQSVPLEQFVSIDSERRKTLQEWERLRALQKKASILRSLIAPVASAPTRRSGFMSL